MPVYGEWPEAKCRLRQRGESSAAEAVFVADFISRCDDALVPVARQYGNHHKR